MVKNLLWVHFVIIEQRILNDVSLNWIGCIIGGCAILGKMRPECQRRRSWPYHTDVVKNGRGICIKLSLAVYELVFHFVWYSNDTALLESCCTVNWILSVHLSACPVICLSVCVSIPICCISGTKSYTSTKLMGMWSISPVIDGADFKVKRSRVKLCNAETGNSIQTLNLVEVWSIRSTISNKCSKSGQEVRVTRSAYCCSYRCDIKARLSTWVKMT